MLNQNYSTIYSRRLPSDTTEEYARARFRINKFITRTWRVHGLSFSFEYVRTTFKWTSILRGHLHNMDTVEPVISEPRRHLFFQEFEEIIREILCKLSIISIRVWRRWKGLHLELDKAYPHWMMKRWFFTHSKHSNQWLDSNRCSMTRFNSW